MAIRDVTILLRVDTTAPSPDSSERAVALIRDGMLATVSSDRTARKVLVDLGLTQAEAADQVRMSHGPMSSSSPPT